ncbi:MAG: hypothetical protein AB1410_06965 [Acidobacteriota bacterium]
MAEKTVTNAERAWFLSRWISEEKSEDRVKSCNFEVCFSICIFKEEISLIKHTEGVWGRYFPHVWGCSAKRLRGLAP